MIKYVSDAYTIFINGTIITMMDNVTQFAHSLSNLGTNDIEYQSLGYDEVSYRFEQIILAGNIAKLNQLTGQNFTQA